MSHLWLMLLAFDTERVCSINSGRNQVTI